MERARIHTRGEAPAYDGAFAVAGETRPSLITPSASEIRFDGLKVRPGAVLSFGIAVDESAWDGDGDGVLFRIRLETKHKRNRHFIFSRQINPVRYREDRRWVDFAIALKPFLESEEARQDAKPAKEDKEQAIALVFQTESGPRDDSVDDVGAWSDPTITYPFFQPKGGHNRPNVLLLSLDTLRADHVGAYGHERGTTPNLDALAADSVVFNRAYAPSNHTLESHMSVMTGLYPATHGVRRKLTQRLKADPLSKQQITLAETLQGQGYSTGGFAYNCIWMQAKYGFGQGFDYYRAIAVGAQRINDEWIFPWLAKQGSRPFFLFVHYYDVHSDWKKLPYEAPAEFIERFAGSPPDDFNACRDKVCATARLMELDRTRTEIPPSHLDYVRHLYDAGVASTDEQVGRLVDKLRELELYDDTMIVVMADHGEEFREHGYLLHHQLYEETLHVPLMIRHPDTIGPARRIEEPVALLGIMPTILDLLGIRPEAPLQSNSLRQPTGDTIMPDRSREPIFISDVISRAVVDWPWKMIVRGRDRELYNLEDDPGEENNLASSHVAKRNQLAATLHKWHRSLDSPATKKQGNNVTKPEGAAAALVPNEADRERLRSLGYDN